MEPRERVKLAMQHKETDRVPVDYWATPNVNRKLCEHLELKYDVQVSSTPYVETNPESLLKFLGIDLRYINIPYAGPPLKKLSDGSLLSVWGTPVPESAWGIPTAIYASAFSRPLAALTRVSQLDSYSWPDPDWWDYSTIDEQCEQFAEYALKFMGDYGPVFCRACDIFGMNRFLILMHTNPELAHAAIDRIGDFYLQFINNILENGGDKADIFYIWDDVAHQDNLFMSLDMWRDYFKPYLRKVYNLIKKYGLKVMQHTCGAMKPLIPEYIELGMDILNPINVKAAGMNPKELKEEFGERITFHGGVDVQHTLPYGTPEEVKKEVHERITVLGKGGGYIMTSSHTLLSDIPVENILAMYREARSLP